jgi:hypothetical protein
MFTMSTISSMRWAREICPLVWEIAPRVHQLNTAGLASLARNTSPCRDFAIMAAMQFVPPLSGPAPRTPDGHPDLSGVWENVRGNVATFAAEVLKRRMAENSKDNPDAHCLVLQD